MDREYDKKFKSRLGIRYIFEINDFISILQILSYFLPPKSALKIRLHLYFLPYEANDYNVFSNFGARDYLADKLFGGPFGQILWRTKYLADKMFGGHNYSQHSVFHCVSV